MSATDLEKTASGESGDCQYFVENPSTLMIIWDKKFAFLTEDAGERVEDGKLRLGLENRGLIIQKRGWLVVD